MSVLNRDLKDIASDIGNSSDQFYQFLAKKEVKPRHVEEVAATMLAVLFLTFSVSVTAPSVVFAQPFASSLGAVVASASTDSSSVQELQAQIASLLAQIKQLQAQLGQTTSSSTQQFCYTFNRNLRIGDQNNDVTNLVTVLNKEGLLSGKTDMFDEDVASAVSGFQENYKSEILTPNNLSHGTGFVGASTRAKLNALYGCGNQTNTEHSSVTSTSGSQTSSVTPTISGTATTPAPIPVIESEQVKCIFNNSSTEQKCYTATNTSSSNWFTCSGTGSCTAVVSGTIGQALTWKSSCGGYAQTTIDGQSESATFSCTSYTQPPPVVTPVTPNTSSFSLINVDFGYGNSSSKVGFAATGQTANDYWNFYTRDDSNGAYRTYGALSNLKTADGLISLVGLTVSNAPGAWGNGSTDPMYQHFIYPLGSGSITINVTNLPIGQYDFYLYNQAGNYQVTVGDKDYGTKISSDPATVSATVQSTPSWQEGQQYVIFRNVQVATAGQPVTITVHTNANGYALISGMQIVKIASSVSGATPPACVNSQNAYIGYSPATDASLSFGYLPNGTEDHAGQWGQFTGNGSPDYNFKATLTVQSQKTIKAMLINTGYSGMSGTTWKCVDGVTPWPVVVYSADGRQLNTDYDQQLGTYSNGSYGFKIYGNKGPTDPAFPTFTLVTYFTDGTYVASAPAPGTTSSSSSGL